MIFIVELFFKKSEEIEGKKPFLKWLKPEKPTYSWEDITTRIFKLSNKIKSLINDGDIEVRKIFYEAPPSI